MGRDPGGTFKGDSRESRSLRRQVEVSAGERKCEQCPTNRAKREDCEEPWDC